MIPAASQHSGRRDKYGWVSGMARSGRGSKKVATDEWGPCDCGGDPPPIFSLPPPPRPPASPSSLGSSSSNTWSSIGEDPDNCDAPWGACPAYLGAREDARTPSQPTSFLVIIVSASAVVLIFIISVIIICKLKCRGRSGKSCTELSGAIIYDDLTAHPAQGHLRTRPRFKPIPLTRQDASHGMCLHLYTPTPHSRPESEHLYMSISSGSETCSYNTSEAITPHQHKRDIMGRRHTSRRPSHHHLDSEEEPLAPSTTEGSDDTPVRTPYHAQRLASSRSPQHASHLSPNHQRQYFFPSAPERSPSPGEESMYYINNTSDRPATPQERGLPPLPSRSDRFKIYFSNDGNRNDSRIYLKSKNPPQMKINNRTNGAFNDGWNSERGSYQPIILSQNNSWGNDELTSEQEPKYENTS